MFQKNLGKPPGYGLIYWPADIPGQYWPMTDITLMHEISFLCCLIFLVLWSNKLIRFEGSLQTCVHVCVFICLYIGWYINIWTFYFLILALSWASEIEYWSGSSMDCRLVYLVKPNIHFAFVSLIVFAVVSTKSWKIIWLLRLRPYQRFLLNFGGKMKAAQTLKMWSAKPPKNNKKRKKMQS